MITRIVKLSFEAYKIDAFIENFNSVKHQIRNAPGNRSLELYQDKKDKNIFFTYSKWETEQDLENYRNSAFFDEVWSFTKKLFNNKPEAWTLQSIEKLE